MVLLFRSKSGTCIHGLNEESGIGTVVEESDVKTQCQLCGAIYNKGKHRM